MALKRLKNVLVFERFIYLVVSSFGIRGVACIIKLSRLMGPVPIYCPMSLANEKVGSR